MRLLAALLKFNSLRRRDHRGVLEFRGGDGVPQKHSR